jgi:cobyrinic acid a,c-diamide synthase
MMSKVTCREIFEHGCRGSDLAIVEGRYAPARSPREASSLESLAQWLDLPQLAIVDVSKLSPCQLPAMPQGVAGLLLDKVKDDAAACRWQTALEAQWGAPVLGWLHEAPPLRSLISARQRGNPCRELCRALGDRLERTLRIDRLVELASARPLSAAPERLFLAPNTDDGLNIAVAFDEAFQGYFADTLDLLEGRGARICDFSPLASEALPWETDVVYIGGGHLESFAEALSGNHCLKQSLRNFVAQGGRVYAEGGGAAYLCERYVSQSGRQFPMAGLISAIATHEPQTGSPEPMEIAFARDTWLGPQGTKLCGYLDHDWQLLPGPGLRVIAAEPAPANVFCGADRVVASRLQVDFAGQPHLVANFFRPRLGALVGVEG